MKKNIKILYICSLIILVISCSSTNKYLYEEDALTLHFKSGTDLNLYDGQAHTLVLCVYQMKDPNTFNQLLDEDDGMPKLLECKRFDASITGSKRIVMQPGQKTTKTLDRAEGTKYLSIIAGYYRTEKEHMYRLKKVPIGLIRKKAKKMKIGFYLGPQEIQEFRGK
jgi:type VI secretion system VasD/TssJ family lipoprotein